MKLLIIDLYGDGESLRICEDKPNIDQIIAEFKQNETSDEHFDEFVERQGVQLFITRSISLEPISYFNEVKDDSVFQEGSLAGRIAKFRLGKIVSTPNALSQLTREDVLTGIGRHQAGDWGDLDLHDREANELALIERTRLWSVYHTTSGVKFWIITEADRSVSTVLLPEDY